MARVIMIQGTMSGAGKSLIVAGLCRVFSQDGYKVAPFKSQNMALNSFVTKDGYEMGRAQVMQAEAARIEPDVAMNPILLKPTGDKGSQVIVDGKVLGDMEAREYFAYKKALIPNIVNAFNRLASQVDIIVIEGAGSPAEVNLKENDIVNMGMAKLVDAPVLLVGDIDRGGVFAQLLGTLMLLDEDENQRIKGLIINKFRGDASLLDSGVDILEEKGNTKVVGIVPYADVHLDDEDSLTERFDSKAKKLIDIVVIRLPKISNFTDFAVFEQYDEVSVRYVNRLNDIGSPDLIIVPGSKNTIEDLRWLKKSGIADRLKELANTVPLIGMCGGFQMLGASIDDPYKVEAGGTIEGLGLLDIDTVLEPSKVRSQVYGQISGVRGIFDVLNDMQVSGYEIHMGRSKGAKDYVTCSESGMVLGSYIHGIFDNSQICKAILGLLADRKAVELNLEMGLSYKDYKELQYDKLANVIRASMDMDYIYSILREANTQIS